MVYELEVTLQQQFSDNKKKQVKISEVSKAQEANFEGLYGSEENVKTFMSLVKMASKQLLMDGPRAKFDL
jgi:hypothetical protein